MKEKESAVKDGSQQRYLLHSKVILDMQNEHKTVIDQMNQEFDNEMSQLMDKHEVELEKRNSGPKEENERLKE